MRKLIFSIFIFVFALSLISLASAYNPFKWQLCDSANMSGGLCDDYWDNFKMSLGISEANTTANLSSGNYFTKSEVIAEIDNRINNLSKIYNETDIDAFISEWFNGNANFSTTALSGLNDSLRQELITFKNSLLDNLDNDYVRIDGRNKSSNTGGISTPWIILIGLAVIGALWFFVSNKKSKSSIERGEAPEMHRTIKSTRALEKEDDISEIKAELRRMKEKESYERPMGRPDKSSMAKKKPIKKQEDNYEEDEDIENSEEEEQEDVGDY